MFLIIVSTFSATSVEAIAGSKFAVNLVKCTDGDTAEFTKVGKTRFLYIDTPESTNQIEPYGKEAAAYTCGLLKNAAKIELQYDGPKKDKYQRTLAWVWITDKGTGKKPYLLQEQIIKKGFVEKFYDYGTYSYESTLIAAQKVAKTNKVGLWKNTSTPPSTTTTPVPTPTPSGEKFQNCTELRKVYPDGVGKDHPSYESKHDRDKDGWACEN